MCAKALPNLVVSNWSWEGKPDGLARCACRIKRNESSIHEAARPRRVFPVLIGHDMNPKPLTVGVLVRTGRFADADTQPAA
ncbi:hypothetical protein Back2_20250 [Nocardioides baekrokdamisoli]|uniref:Uncharacterized protein n=1 Tax=Nocardioides baekrokdamisoli TaxID=1804624 RepID=A0A3G9J2C9_9ACTN|nr:hypothetical protein Back2_20250 [Nocardioides baekrokdamisoli]